MSDQSVFHNTDITHSREISDGRRRAPKKKRMSPFFQFFHLDGRKRYYAHLSQREKKKGNLKLKPCQAEPFESLRLLKSRHQGTYEF